MELKEDLVLPLLPNRRKDSHKGTFGKVMVLGGSINYPGAPRLAALSALRVGAGFVTLAIPKAIYTCVASSVLEPTILALLDQDGFLVESAALEVLEKIEDYDSLVLGPGLGFDEKTKGFIGKLLTFKLPKTVIDADGLNCLSKMERFWEKMNGDFILTPHPGEMARLTGISINEIQKNREKIAGKFAKKWKVVLVLKGAKTVIANKAGEFMVCPFERAALATAGSGDVLAGMIGGFLAQGLDSFDAACVAVFIHGMAGGKLEEEMGDAGILASDIINLLPKVLKSLKEEK